MRRQRRRIGYRNIHASARHRTAGDNSTCACPNAGAALV